MSIEIRGLTKRYGSLQALSAVDLSVKSGEFVTLLGPSGSGKTTLLNLIAGTDEPSGGSIMINGSDVTRLPTSKRGLGMVFQNYALMPHMSVYENIAFPLRVRKKPEHEIQRKVDEILALIQLPDIRSRKPKQLSGGQQQRVALARALVYDPSVVLMDEPLGALDKKLREQMQLELKRLHRQLGLTVVFVTHDQEEALTMSDQIVLLNHGRIVQQGTADELYFKPKSLFAAQFLGDSNVMAGTVSGIGHAAVGYALDGAKIAFDDAGRGLSDGTPVTLMVRPENLAVVDEGREKYDNVLQGPIHQTIVAGGVIKHFVDVGNARGSLLLAATELNRTDRVARQIGDTVEVGWKSSDCHAFPRNN